MILKLSNLLGHTLSLFLFSAAFKEYWKVEEGTLICCANAKVLDKKDEINQQSVALSLNFEKQMLVIGRAADFGYCKAYKNENWRTKSMVKCKNVINTSKSEFCDYHIKTEYNKIAAGRVGINRRSEIY